MIENSKPIEVNDTIEFTCDKAHKLTHLKQHIADDIQFIYGDHGQGMLVEMGEYFLIVHNFQEDFVYYIMDIHTESLQSELDEDITITINGCESSYIASSNSWFSENQEFQMCLYENNELEYDRMFVVGKTLYIGIEIEENEIIINGETK